MPSHRVTGRKLSRYRDQRVALLRGLVAAHGVKVAFVDSLQKLTAPKTETRTLEVGTVIRGLKNLAKDLHIPEEILDGIIGGLGHGLGAPAKHNHEDQTCYSPHWYSLLAWLNRPSISLKIKVPSSRYVDQYGWLPSGKHGTKMVTASPQQIRSAPA